jgi:ATP-dependent DNA helicase RecG
VEDNGKVLGVPQKAAQDIVKNFISVVGNPQIISTTAYLYPEILEYKGKKIIRLHIPSSSEVHTLKKIIYDRVDDADVKVTATGQIAQMYIRKQSILRKNESSPMS